ncbi:MAG: urease accessory UreF family protein [Pseudorhodobacter sp.]|nr:urease accessory UreF family protein [Pseudorhodobacter sp.]
MDAARLTLWQWLSPAFPTGAFACSSGLEWAMAQGVVGRDTLAEWLADWVRFGGGWTDAVLLGLGLRPDADLAGTDSLGRALCLSAERLAETLDQGTAFALTVAALNGTDQPPAILPVAVARATAPLGLPVAEVIAAFLHGMAANQIHAAVRFLPMGQIEGQRILAGLHPVLMQVAHRAATAELADLGTAAFGAEMAAFAHETMATRMFRT